MTGQRGGCSEEESESKSAIDSAVQASASFYRVELKEVSSESSFVEPSNPRNERPTFETLLAKKALEFLQSPQRCPQKLPS